MVLPKVLFVINSLAGGGAERVLATILEHSRPRRGGYDIRLALLDAEPEIYGTPAWLRVHRLQGAGGLFESVRSLGALVRAWEPDVVVSFLTRSNIANALVNLRRERAIILAERVHTLSHLGAGVASLPARSLVRLCYPRADHVIAVSGDVGAHLIQDFGVPEHKVSVVYNPLDVERVQGLAKLDDRAPPERPFVMAMGRLVKNKNFELLIRAYSEWNTDFSLVIAGEGPERARLEQLAKDLGVSDRVQFPGFVQNPYALLRRAQVYVLPSNAEGFPNGLVEAMALGLPVIATDCHSGPAEILEGAAATGRPVDGRWGVLVATNDVAGMRKALESFSCPERRGRFATLAARRALDFDVKGAVDAYWEVIEGALQARRRTAQERPVELA